MKTDIKDYFHLYLGQDVYVFPSDTYSNGWLKARLKEQPELRYKFQVTIDNLKEVITTGYKLLLRDLASMTEEEGNVFFKFRYRKSSVFAWYNCININAAGIEFEFTYITSNRKRNKILMWDSLSPDEFSWLLTQGFDLFNLIPQKLAIKL